MQGIMQSKSNKTDADFYLQLNANKKLAPHLGAAILDWGKSKYNFLHLFNMEAHFCNIRKELCFGKL